MPTPVRQTLPCFHPRRTADCNQSPISTWQEGGAVSHTPLTQDNPILQSADWTQFPHIPVSPVRTQVSQFTKQTIARMQVHQKDRNSRRSPRVMADFGRFVDLLLSNYFFFRAASAASILVVTS
jgi:hypothetical protein